MSKPKQKPGPLPDLLKIPGDWRDALRKAIHKRRPKEGWPPKPEKPFKRS